VARGPDVILSARQNARLRQRLQALAKREGLSERALAGRAGLSIGAVRSVGGTAAGPTLGTLLALAKALRLQSIDQLLGPSATSLMARHDRLEGAVGEPTMTIVMGADEAQ
jgi:transcriptional regulator with XRE-family HTH domain